MLEHSIYSLGEPIAVELSTKIPREQFDGFRGEFDAVADTYKAE